ncbi:hypothetical protein [Herbidospora daliensis]|uniref:hypothetical protein n=1 Tax=Herbidospora daliensis TaxID=295585 RepID=UPI0012F96DE8|nr:hypothetical protein [Herbidospora daliensis]
MVFPLISAQDISGLYRRAHRARTVVIAFGSAKILLDGRELPSNKGCMSLEKFIRYKCFYVLISRLEEVEKGWAKALDWMNERHCEGPNDPRCFPVAAFDAQGECSLDSAAGRQEFIALHKETKSSKHLTDACGRTWQRGPDHSRDLIQVAGTTLPIGFHWDVQAARNSTIATGWEVWHLPKGGYTNIHPDAMVRGGHATKKYPSSAGSSKPKTPKAARSQARRKK